MRSEDRCFFFKNIDKGPEQLEVSLMARPCVLTVNSWKMSTWMFWHPTCLFWMFSATIVVEFHAFVPVTVLGTTWGSFCLAGTRCEQCVIFKNDLHWCHSMIKTLPLQWTLHMCMTHVVWLHDSLKKSQSVSEQKVFEPGLILTRTCAHACCAKTAAPMSCGCSQVSANSCCWGIPIFLERG